MIDHGKHNLLGIMIDAVDYEAAVARIVDAAKHQRALTVSALAVHGLMTGTLDPVHRYRLNSFDMLASDGQPVRWALNRLHGTRLPDRVYGPTLMLETCRRAADEQLPVFLFGGSAELLVALRRRLAERFPQLRIAGTRASRFRRLTEMERVETVEEIRSSGAAITFVGLGCPRQEVWAYEFRDSLSMPILAVGAAFNFHAGLLPQAPPVLQKFGLEWSFRLISEPGRLWRRYLLLNPLYVGMLCWQLLGLPALDPRNAQPPSEELLYG